MPKPRISPEKVAEALGDLRAHGDAQDLKSAKDCIAQWKEDCDVQSGCLKGALDALGNIEDPVRAAGVVQDHLADYLPRRRIPESERGPRWSDAERGPRRPDDFGAHSEEELR